MPAKKGANLINKLERCEASRSDPGDQVGLHVRLQKLQEQDEHAKLLKDRLRWEQRELRTRLEKLQGGSERMRNDSLGSAVSSERSDSEREDVEIDVESMVWTLESDGLGSSHAGVDHSYSTSDHNWL
uniref:Max dimerization protein 3-like n=1 Tax=Sinocyclocheilus anshuiensis TaxID=1608454 RepID=A0A671SFW3_9TELE